MPSLCDYDRSSYHTIKISSSNPINDFGGACFTAFTVLCQCALFSKQSGVVIGRLGKRFPFRIARGRSQFIECTTPEIFEKLFTLRFKECLQDNDLFERMGLTRRHLSAGACM